MTAQAARRIHYVGWGGRDESRPVTMHLGYGTRTKLPSYGVRRAAFDAAFGYVNGFPFSAIAYFILTRSLNRRLSKWAMQREGIQFIGDLPVASSTPTNEETR